MGARVMIGMLAALAALAAAAGLASAGSEPQVGGEAGWVRCHRLYRGDPSRELGCENSVPRTVFQCDARYRAPSRLRGVCERQVLCFYRVPCLGRIQALYNVSGSRAVSVIGRDGRGITAHTGPATYTNLPDGDHLETERWTCRSAPNVRIVAVYLVEEALPPRRPAYHAAPHTAHECHARLVDTRHRDGSQPTVQQLLIEGTPAR